MRDAEAQLIHDLRNAATVLRAAAAQLQEDGEMPAGVADQLVEIIGRRSDMVLGLLDELALLHQADEGQAGEASQRVVLADVCHDALERRAPSGTEVTLAVAEDVVAVGDPMRIVRILDNLLTNAFRYGGSHVVVSARRDGSFVSLEVHDNGDGVPADIADHVFDAHVRGPMSESLGGSGLGLAIVRELCASMGGTVAYRTRAGASFTVVLPAAPDTAPGDAGSDPELTSWASAPRPADELAAALAPVGAMGDPDPTVWRSRLSTGRRPVSAA
jgi:signal transduction histidine kinase